MSHDISTFTPPVMAKIQANLRSRAPWLVFSPVMYYVQGGTWVWTLWPDLALVLDAPLFTFCNDKQGYALDSPCRQEGCPWPRKTNGTADPDYSGCLAGWCADPTVYNAPGEIVDMASLLPPPRKLIVAL